MLSQDRAADIWTTSKVITLDKSNNWRYELLKDPDAIQGFSYEIDPDSVREHNAGNYNFIGTPVVTTDDEGNVTYTCVNEKQTTVSVEKSWSPSLPTNMQGNAYVNVELRRYVKLRGAFTVELTSSEDDAPIQGATFALYRVGDGEDTLVQSDLTTDENGRITVSNLEPGEYYYVQTGEANGYSMGSPAPVTEHWIVRDDTDERQEKTVTVKNTPTRPLFEFRLTLTDNTGEPIPGARFQLYEGENPVSGKVYRTDAAGVISDHDLPAGTYFLRQIDTPEDDYRMPVFTDTPACTADQPGVTHAEWTMVNNCRGKGVVDVTLLRSDDGNPIGGVQFSLKNEAGDVVATGTTGPDGRLTLPTSGKLAVGQYTLQGQEDLHQDQPAAGGHDLHRDRERG